MALPAGASILSAEVAGQKVKPVEGADGSRVPLLRPGFTPPETTPYRSDSWQRRRRFQERDRGLRAAKNGHAGRGDGAEVFLPQQYRVSDFAGDATAAELMGMTTRIPATALTAAPGADRRNRDRHDGSGSQRRPVTVVHDYLRRTFHATTDPNGRWSIASVPAGRVTVTIVSPGFVNESRAVEHDAGRGSAFHAELKVGAQTESVTVTAENSVMQRNARQNAAPPDLTASANVADLQRRVVGVLPIAINVPKAGNSYRFVRPLVVDETTRLTFRYRRK